MPYLSKKIIIPMAAVAVIGAGVYGAGQVSAQGDSGQDPHASIVQRLADTFHVDKSKVQAVFDQEHQDHMADMEKRYEERLTQAVKDGKLTEDQKSKVLAKHNELRSKMDELMKDDGTDKRDQMKALHDDAKQWADDNGIDAKWLMGGGPGMGIHIMHDRGPGMGSGHPMMVHPGMPGDDEMSAPSTAMPQTN